MHHEPNNCVWLNVVVFLFYYTKCLVETAAKSLAGARHAKSPQELCGAINSLVQPDVTLEPASENIRYRHVIKGNRHFYIFFNEEAGTVRATFRED